MANNKENDKIEIENPEIIEETTQLSEEKVDDVSQKSASNILDFFWGFAIFTIIDLALIVGNNMLAVNYNNSLSSIIWIPILLLINIYSIKKSTSKSFKNGILLSFTFFFMIPLIISGSCFFVTHGKLWN